MSEGRLSSRNAAIQEMLTDGEKIQNFYRFVAQKSAYQFARCLPNNHKPPIRRSLLFV